MEVWIMFWYRATIRSLYVAVLAAIVLVALGGVTLADFTFGEPVNIQSEFPFVNSATDWI
jgi:hypothetical protein